MALCVSPSGSTSHQRPARLAVRWPSCNRLAVTLLIALLPAAHPLAKATAEPTSAVADKEINQWIAQLDSDLYIVRVRATDRLGRAGRAAIAPLAQAADGKNLEVATRAVRVLLELSQSEDDLTAIDALHQVARLENRPAERAAAQVTLVHRLGAVEKLWHSASGHRAVAHLHIGESWTGGDGGIRYVKAYRALQMLTIHGVPLTDKSVEHLAGLTELVRLELYGTNITDAGIARLTTALPNVAIDYRRGALLGVKAIPQSTVAQVAEVLPDSAAAAAGLMAGDVITKFNGQPISDFQSLTSQIAVCRPGDTAEVELVRQGTTLTKRVTLGKWK